MVFKLLPPGLLLPRGWICFAPKVEPTALKIAERIGFCLHLLCSRETERIEYHALTFYLLLFMGRYNKDSFQPEPFIWCSELFSTPCLCLWSQHCVTSKGQMMASHSVLLSLLCPSVLAVSFCTPHQYLSVCVLCVCACTLVMLLGYFLTAFNHVASMSWDTLQILAVAKQKTCWNRESRLVSNWSCCFSFLWLQKLSYGPVSHFSAPLQSNLKWGRWALI